MTNSSTIRVWQIGGTDKAYLFSTQPKNCVPPGHRVWVPRSVITHVSRMPCIVNQWQECGVTIQDWWLKTRRELQELVK